MLRHINVDAYACWSKNWQVVCTEGAIFLLAWILVNEVSVQQIEYTMEDQCVSQLVISKPNKV